MTEKERFTKFLIDNTESEEEALIYFRLCSFINEHGDGRVKADFHRIFPNEAENVEKRIAEATRLLKEYQEQNNNL